MLYQHTMMRRDSLQDERLSVLGTLTAGLFHEICTPLTYVTMQVDLVDRKLNGFLERPSAAGAESLKRSLGHASEGLKRANAIIRDVRLFASLGEGESVIQWVDLGDVIQSALTIASVELRHYARVQTDFAVLPLLRMNRSKIGQVFLNLFLNAAQAMQLSPSEMNCLQVKTNLGVGNSVVIEISDTGPGIDKSLQERVFERFFTTKPSGTGLGLWICREILQELQGTLEIVESNSSGTRVRVILPSELAQSSAS